MNNPRAKSRSTGRPDVAYVVTAGALAGLVAYFSFIGIAQLYRACSGTLSCLMFDIYLVLPLAVLGQVVLSAVTGTALLRSFKVEHAGAIAKWSAGEGLGILILKFGSQDRALLLTGRWLLIWPLGFALIYLLFYRLITNHGRTQLLCAIFVIASVLGSLALAVR